MTDVKLTGLHGIPINVGNTYIIQVDGLLEWIDTFKTSEEGVEVTVSDLRTFKRYKLTRID